MNLLVGSLRVGAENRSTGSTASQLLYWPGKSVEKTWPVTEVTLMRAACPSKRPWNSCTGGERPVEEGEGKAERMHWVNQIPVTSSQVHMLL
jgi:hypothetical protein